ncbi:MAG: M28 family peptidase [Calditrichaeota bacterium]|nr:MAG: hypothetical protein DWQ03_14970 [Calditrichota bacterium]MBL1206460.1 M28 family peptidase [Calditrichota bacterium]NOG46287.1 M28 family peptidase [Calditrichota bacterium]
MKKLLLFLLPLISFAQNDHYINYAKESVKYLTSKDLMGRGYTHDGHIKAAKFIESELLNIGLDKIDDSYSQEFEVEVNIFEREPHLIINDKWLKLGTDFIPHEHSSSGDISSNKVVYVDNGIFIPDAGLNDYNGLSANGKIIIIDNELPQHLKKNKQFSKFTSESTRILIAQKLGAKAIVLIQDKLTFGAAYTRLQIPIVRVLKSSLQNPIEKVELEVESDFDDFDTKNIFGFIKGTSIQDSIIMLCAHYDHLGALGDSVYFPGANDNASGVSLLLSLAKFFKDNPIKNSLLFTFFSGEDVGLVGSKYFQKNPEIELERVKFLINFDMAASAENGIMAVGGKNFPEFFQKLKSINDDLSLGKLGSRKNAPNSDHYFFIRNGIKGFYLFTKDGKQPYHHVNDKFETLEWDDFERMFNLAKSFIQSI